jgi:hypothetical protein
MSSVKSRRCVSAPNCWMKGTMEVGDRDSEGGHRRRPFVHVARRPMSTSFGLAFPHLACVLSSRPVCGVTPREDGSTILASTISPKSLSGSSIVHDIQLCMTPKCGEALSSRVSIVRQCCSKRVSRETTPKHEQPTK